MKFRDLISSLKHLGFSQKTNDQKQTFFLHQPSSSIIAFPKYSARAQVPSLLLVNIQNLLRYKNLLAAVDLEKAFSSIQQQKTKPAVGNLKPLRKELWKPLRFPGWKDINKKYALSSRGRIASYKKDILEDGKLLNASITDGYKTLTLHRPGNKRILYIDREVAKLFNKKPTARHKYLVHINYKKLDNRAENLRWVTLEMMTWYQQRSPGNKRQRERVNFSKLSASQVAEIKKKLSDKRRKLTIKEIADKYQVSEFTIYRSQKALKQE